MASLWPASEFASWSHLKTAIVGQILTRSLLKLDIAILAALQRLFQIASGNKWKRSFWAKSWTGDLLSRIALICSSNALCHGHCGPNPDQEPFEARYCHFGGLAAPIPNCFWKQVESLFATRQNSAGRQELFGVPLFPGRTRRAGSRLKTFEAHLCFPEALNVVLGAWHLQRACSALVLAMEDLQGDPRDVPAKSLGLGFILC